MVPRDQNETGRRAGHSRLRERHWGTVEVGGGSRRGLGAGGGAEDPLGCRSTVRVGLDRSWSDASPVRGPFHWGIADRVTELVGDSNYEGIGEGGSHGRALPVAAHRGDRVRGCRSGVRTEPDRDLVGADHSRVRNLNSGHTAEHPLRTGAAVAPGACRLGNDLAT